MPPNPPSPAFSVPAAAWSLVNSPPTPEIIDPLCQALTSRSQSRGRKPRRAILPNSFPDISPKPWMYSKTYLQTNSCPPGHGVRHHRHLRRGDALAARGAQDALPRLHHRVAVVVICARSRCARPAGPQPRVPGAVPEPLREQHARVRHCMPLGALVSSYSFATISRLTHRS